MSCSLIPIRQLLEERPDIRLVAEFPSEGRLAYSSVILVDVHWLQISLQSIMTLKFIYTWRYIYNYHLGSGLFCSYIEIDQMFESELNSDISLPSQLSSHTSDGSMFMSFSESSYNSDHGSGNEDVKDSSFAVFEESSDEVDFLVV